MHQIIYFGLLRPRAIDYHVHALLKRCTIMPYVRTVKYKIHLCVRVWNLKIKQRRVCVGLIRTWQTYILVTHDNQIIRLWRSIYSEIKKSSICRSWLLIWYLQAFIGGCLHCYNCEDILLTCANKLHDCLVSVRDMWAHKTTWLPTVYIEMPIPSYDGKR